MFGGCIESDNDESSEGSAICYANLLCLGCNSVPYCILYLMTGAGIMTNRWLFEMQESFNDLSDYRPTLKRFRRLLTIRLRSEEDECRCQQEGIVFSQRKKSCCA